MLRNAGLKEKSIWIKNHTDPASNPHSATYLLRNLESSFWYVQQEFYNPPEKELKELIKHIKQPNTVAGTQ